jgi:hypothetical protein
MSTKLYYFNNLAAYWFLMTNLETSLLLLEKQFLFSVQKFGLNKPSIILFRDLETVAKLPYNIRWATEGGADRTTL